MVNPTLQGSSVNMVLPAASALQYTSIPLDTRQLFTLKYKFGGIKAGVTGAGAATGTAVMGAGLEVTASAAVLYQNGAFSVSF